MGSKSRPSWECRLRRRFMLGRFRYSLGVLTAIALSTAIMSPPLGAEPAAQPPELTPMDYPLSPSDQSKLPPPQLPEPQQTGTSATPPQVTGPQPSEQPGPPSPLLGKAPPLPLSLPMAERARKNPALLQEWQKGLNPVTNKPAPSPAIHGSGGKAAGRRLMELRAFRTRLSAALQSTSSD